MNARRCLSRALGVVLLCTLAACASVQREPEDRGGTWIKVEPGTAVLSPAELDKLVLFVAAMMNRIRELEARLAGGT